MTDVSQLLQQLAFRRSGDSALEAAAVGGDERAFHTALQKYFAKPGKRFQKLTGLSGLSSAWSVNLEWPDEPDRHLAELILTGSSGTTHASESYLSSVAEFLIGCFRDESEELTPFVALTAVELLLRHLEHVSATDAAMIFVGLCRLAAEPFTLPDELTLNGESIVFNLVAVCELPFALSILLDSLKHSKQLREQGRLNLSRILYESTDTDGTPHSCVVSRVRQWLSPFVRVVCWAAVTESKWAAKKTECHWQKQLTRFVTLATSDGFVSDSRIAFGAPVLEDFGFLQLGLAVQLAGFELPSRVVIVATELAKGKRPARRKKSRKNSDVSQVTEGSEQSDWAHLAIMRTGLHLEADGVSVKWDEPVVGVGVATLGHRIVGGEWAYELSVNGENVPAPVNWGCTCWFQDDEVAFAELESNDSGSVRHVRQILLSLVDHFAVFTDSVTCENAESMVKFTSRIPLHGVTATTNTITRELRLRSTSVDVRVIPTWLEDDRLLSSVGDCRLLDGDLELSSSGAGGVTLPMLMDWNPHRVKADADWNRLTVSEERCVKSSWEAAAYRARIGRLQMLIYRSLRTGDSLRAVLGLNTKNETVYGIVANSGSIAPLVMVDSEQ